MKFGSLFSGIGGFDLGFERAGIESVWQVEIDKSCLNLLEKRFPSAERHNDVKEFRGAGSVDLICGGFPCQDLSVAGKRAGLAGERSGLWFEFHRVIAETHPRWVIIENVPGLLSSNKGWDFAIILRGLVQLGYGVAWRILDARYFGVAQRRRRVFIVASLGNGSCAQVLFESEGMSRDSTESGETRQVAPSLFASGAGTSRTASTGSEAEFCVPVAIRTNQTGANGNNIWTDETGTLNQGGPDAVIAKARNHHSGRYDYESETFVTAPIKAANPSSRKGGSNPTASEFVVALANGSHPETEVGRALPLRSDRGSGGRQAIAYKIRGGKEGGGKGFLGAEEIAFTVSGFSDQYLGVRRLTPTECERLQGFPDGWTFGSDSSRYRQLGNAVCVPVAEWIGKRIIEADKLTQIKT